MHRILLFLFLLAAFFTGGFTGARWLKSHALWKKGETASHTDAPFKPTSFCVENLPFVIAIVGKNNGAWVEKLLLSVSSQNYPNYRIVYIDDASDDGSFELARDLICAQTSSVNISVMRNEEPLGFIKSLARVVRECKDREIVVVLHGEDRLAHEWVLQRLNQYYANPDLWITYGQYLMAPSYQVGICRALRENERPRSAPFFASHLKTFYARLFKMIRETDFDSQGDVGVEMAIRTGFAFSIESGLH